ncbi:hypothetical protein CPB84DRAFT_994363 [Gymnopilus junonius]|uniref:Uncharacterized protein n=1 Tax=Gymnopilus junonius TaxID=109634 RepID=A0A9P5TNI2_GYMJU|nr:hypothetical protein CPB84DRAFT_994363 [Gymnopilus junonius]
MTGIASYIRAFSVHMVGTASMVRPTLDDGTMAIIFRKIFNTGEPGSAPHSLSLTFGTTANLRSTFDWSTLNQDFLQAFHGLCRKPLLTTLHLSRFINLPPTLLINTAIKTVKLSQIRLFGTQSYEFTDPPTFIAAPNDDPVISDLPFQKDQVVFLESIDTDQSFPLLEILDMTPGRSIPPSVIFSKLRNLTLQIEDRNDFEKAESLLTHSAASLEQLEVNVSFHQHVADPIDFAQLPSGLKSLIVKHNCISYKDPGISIILPISSCLLSRPPPTLEKIEMTLFLFSGYEDRTVSDIFEGHQYALLDELFSHPRFYCLKHLTLRFIFNLYVDKPLIRGNFKRMPQPMSEGLFQR